MCCPNMSPNLIPTPCRGLRVLLVDNDTTSLLNVAKELESFSYRVTTTELATVALSILRERKDRFDVIMADTNMPEMDCFDFIESAHIISDFPIILMSSEFDKSMVERAMIKGACFILNKPISSKNLKNVWQHVFRQRRNNKITHINVNTKSSSSSEQGADSKVELETADARTSEISGHVGDGEKIENGQNDDLSRICTKRFIMSTENDETGQLKRKRKERAVGNSEQGDSNKRSRFDWSDVQLQLKGVAGAKGKGVDSEARPESTLEMTMEPNLKPMQVSSGVQKHKAKSSTTELNQATPLPGDQPKILATPSNFNSFNKTEFLSVTPSYCPRVGTMETNVNKRSLSGDIHKQANRVDEIQAFTGSSQSLSTFLEVASRNKYHKRS